MQIHRIGVRPFAPHRCHALLGRFAAVMFGILLLVGVTARAAHGDTWAERLGFPAGKKVVLLHASELGMCYETNAAGEKLLDGDLVRSGAAMVPCPWFCDLIPWLTAPSQAEVGLSLTLNSPSQSYRWKPVAPQESVSSLTDADGYFWQSPLQTMVNATPDEVERELEAQIAQAKSFGLKPTHFTTYLGTLVMRPDLMEIYLRVARRHWVPAVVVELTPEQVERFAKEGFPLPPDVIHLLSDYPLPKVDDLRFIPPADSYEAKKKAFLSLLHDLQPGITQIAVSPAEESEALKHITPNWQQRVWEAQLLQDDDVRKLLHGDDYILTDWREMMDRFQSQTSQPGKPGPKD
jgi:predicted glycoside hydrolase/deacetylase ChbG (UPF0249 family)